MATADMQISHYEPSGQHDDLETQNQSWTDAQQGKQNASCAPRGYISDASSVERLMDVSGGRHRAISLTTVLQHRAGVSAKANGGDGLDGHSNRDVISSTAPKPPPSRIRSPERGRGNKRKRSKYSSLPKDIEKALDLIASHLEDMSQVRKSQDDIEIRSRDLEQKVRMQEGKVVICRQELQVLSRRLAEEVSSTDKLRAENAEFRKQLQDTRALADIKENEMKNWRNMLRTMMTIREDSSMS
jgi:hypothetical protein